MPRRQRTKATTTLAQHRTPDLAELLDKAKTCELTPLRRFLAAGGHADALVTGAVPGGFTGSAPLLYIAMCRSPLLPDYKDSIELLLAAGANVNVLLKAEPEGAELSLLMSACQSLSIETLKILLQHGASVCLQSPSGFTALHVAARRGCPEKCKLLLQADRSALELRACGGQSTIYAAVLGGHLPVIELLHKSYGADLFTRDDDGLTLLHAAVLADAPAEPLLAYLLRNGLDINAVSNTMQTTLHVAAYEGSAAAVQMLIEQGADTGITDDNGNTAVGSACTKGRADVVELLLNNGIQASATVDAAGHTLLMIAAANECMDVVRVLLQHGADVLAADAEN
jgi:ankyrin repeat protein